MTAESVRGAGKARGGATDTTMLIWKVIEANPGITRAGIWERVEQDIPAGYALRSYSADMAKKGKSLEAVSPASKLFRARGFILTIRLSALRKTGSVSWEGRPDSRRYTAVREPVYWGSMEAIDVEGTKAAEHLAVADALRTLEKMRAKVDHDRPVNYWPRMTRKEDQALAVVIKTLRAQ